MLLSECSIGVIVQNREGLGEPGTSEVGHIVGLTVNQEGEIIPTVSWCRPHTFDDGDVGDVGITMGIHPSNLQPYIED